MHIYSLNNKHKHTYIYTYLKSTSLLFMVSADTRNSLATSIWPSGNPCARADINMADAQIPSGLRPIHIQSFLKRVISRRATVTTAFILSPRSSLDVYVCVYICGGGVVSCIWVSWRVACVSFI